METQVREDCQIERKRKASPEVGIDLSLPHTKRIEGNSNNEGQQQNTNKKVGETSDGKFVDFSGFKLEKILSNSIEQKRIVLQGRYAESDQAVIILDKKPFSEEVVVDILSAQSKLRNTFQNDIYGSYDCYPDPSASEIKTTIVYPATEKHIEKYISQKVFLIEETSAVYNSVTLPYLQESSFNIQWVFNILEHKKEVDRIAYEDSDPNIGFILLPDLKWDGIALENLYLVAIVHPKGIKSLRDLKTEHIPLLENILESGTVAIKKKYGVKRSELRVYVHYQPSYYHLHVHFTALQFNAPGIYPEKSHLLSTIIGNIKSNSSYYQEATLPFVVKENDLLCQKLVNHGYSF